MRQTDIEPIWFRRAFLLLLVIGISALFLAMIRIFLTTLLLAAIFSGLSYPLYRKLLGALRGRATLASLATLVVFLLVLVVPLSAFFGIVTAQAIEVSQAVAPWVEQQVGQREQLEELLRSVPFLEMLQPYADQILSRVGEVAGRTGVFVVEKLAAFTRGTVTFLFLLFVMLYAMFFFLKDGRRVLELILYYMPLSSEDENRMLGKFVSVSRATVKGTLVIGILQGALAGLGFAVAGVPAPAFWGTVMAVLSILPGVGAALVWIPAVVYLFVVGRAGAAIGLGAWCAAVVGTVDNLLRPRLVGRDTQLPDLLILLSTLGGVVLFGAAGIIVGPILAALFVTVWEIYGVAFRDFLPEARLTEAAAWAGGPGEGPEPGAGAATEPRPGKGPEREPGEGPDQARRKGAGSRPLEGPERGPGEDAEPEPREGPHSGDG